MGGSWEKLGTADGGSGSISVTFSAKDNLRVLFQQNTAVQCKIQFNDDTGSNTNYSLRRSEDGGSDATPETGQSYMRNWNSGSATQRMTIMDIVNPSDRKKICMIETVESTDGSNNVPNRMESVGKWANTSEAITKITFTALSGTIDSNATLTVLGASSNVVSDEKTTISDIPTNTRYEETDTRKIYRRADAVTPKFEETFADNSRSWNLSSSEVTISGGTLNITNNSSGDDNIAYLDISSFLTGSALPSGWTMRFKVILTDYKNNASGQAVAIHAGVSSNTSLTGENASSTDSAHIKIGSHAASDNGNFQLQQWRSGTSRQDTTSSNNFSNPFTATIYCELKANGTTLSMIGYDNADYTSPNTYANSGNITLSNTYNNYKYVFFKFFYQNISESVTTKFDDVKIYETADSVDASWKERGSA